MRVPNACVSRLHPSPSAATGCCAPARRGVDESPLRRALKVVVGFSLRHVLKAAALIELVRTLVLQSYR